MIQLEKVCFICKPPIQIKKDERNELHCITDFAIKFVDGYGQHYLWGVYFSPEDFQKYVINRVPAKEVFNIQNQEQKAAIIKLYGYKKLLEDLPDCKVIDELEKQGKQHILYTFVLTTSIHPKFLMLEDFSTNRKYFLGVPNTCRTVQEALAWTFNTTVDEYSKMVIET